MVRAKGLEPPRLSPPEPKSGVSTSFTTPASATHALPSVRTIARHERGALAQPRRDDKQPGVATTSPAAWMLAFGDQRSRGTAPVRTYKDCCRKAAYGPMIALNLIISRLMCIAPMHFRL